jgi:hypothetical protein
MEVMVDSISSGGGVRQRLRFGEVDKISPARTQMIGCCTLSSDIGTPHIAELFPPASQHTLGGKDCYSSHGKERY